MHDQHEIPLILLVPFALLLAAIAVMPLMLSHFWESNRNKLIIALVCSVPVLGFLIYNAMWGELKHALLFDYVPFLILLGALFVITGGINITGDIEAKPSINTAFMASWGGACVADGNNRCGNAPHPSTFGNQR
jgi:hypothetical protein